MSRKAQTSERDFLDELQEIARAARADLEARQVGLDPSPAARLERRRRVLVARDFEFFCYTYFPHHIRPPKSQFHAHFFGSLCGELRRDFTARSVEQHQIIAFTQAQHAHMARSLFRQAEFAGAGQRRSNMEAGSGHREWSEEEEARSPPACSRNRRSIKPAV